MAAVGTVAAALEALLVPGGQGRAVLHPRLVAAVGAEPLGEVPAATRARVGPVVAVTESPEHGLVVEGERGRVPAWGVVAADGRLTGLMISPRPIPSGGRIRRALTAGRARLYGLAWGVPVIAAVTCWTASTGTGWASGPGLLAVVWTGALALRGWVTLESPARWLLGVTTATALASAWRPAVLPFGHPGPADALLPAVLALLLPLGLCRPYRGRHITG